jgi:hypothetical protein
MHGMCIGANRYRERKWLGGLYEIWHPAIVRELIHRVAVMRDEA